MIGTSTKTRLLACVALLVLLPGCVLFRRRNSDLATNVNPGDQPDKILFEKASKEIDRGRFDVGRLTLQTLINTYPDSEYLAKAKLEIADSYYKEGGVSGLTQAEAEYKDFITFFPTAPEAPEAEFRAGMSHFRLMAKYDRDRSEAKMAETEFKLFLQKYPDSPLMPRVKNRLRETQEVLAHGDFEIARLYYQRGAMPAASSRFREIADKYPDYSEADEALWYLGQSLERLRKPNEAAPYYARILTDYPLSPTSRDAKARLKELHQPIPKPTRAMMARAKADAVARRRAHRSMLARFGGTFASGPDYSQTRHGPVRIGEAPAGETVEAKTNPPGNGNESIAVQRLSDSDSPAAEAGPETASSPDAAASPAQANGDSAKTPATSTTASAPDSKAKGDSTADSAQPPKKKKKHRLLKIIPY